ncbi:MAG: DUF4982 domain-containing protein, partial [Chloroflexi bacterium]|nr:DUF4982 domain-containing protein [Chloroflexota bacterium]
VYLNGHELGEHPSGYTGFEYDISRAAHFGGTNVLAVHVDPRHYEGWWYEGGGIYRHVWLTVTGPLHLAPTYVSAAAPEPGAASPAATVQIHSTLENDGPDTAAELVSTVYDDRGQAAGVSRTPFRLAAGRTWNLQQYVIVARPRLWSLDTPHLYRVSQVVVRGQRAVDDADTVFGIRSIRFDPATGFYLNGKPVKIKGTANHQDFAGVGIGVPDRLEYWRVARLKAMGCNAWRTAHNPPSPALLDACDRLGMLVMDENRHLADAYSPKTPAGTPASNLLDLASMIRRDRNHPSVILWSLCNEEGLQGTPEGARLFGDMVPVVHQYDRSRPITCAMSGGWFLPGFRTVEDVVGVNYHTAVYDRFHTQFPQIPLFGSETANSKSTRGAYVNDRADGWVSSYNLPEDAWAAVADRPFVAGSFVWTGYDYGGEPNPYGWPDVNSNTGLMDVCGFPKDKYYYFRAWWLDRPMVHLSPHWNWPGKEAQPVRVMALSNCERVELFLNGKSLGSQPALRNGHVEWNVPYEPGTLLARGYNGTSLAATDVDETTGVPAALRLHADRTVLSADGEDVEPVEVGVVDSRGRLVPTAGNRITFTVTGAGHVAGVGNGNPSDHDAAKARSRRAFNGRCLVLVGAADRPGRIVLTAASPGLRMVAEPAAHAAGQRIQMRREEQSGNGVPPGGGDSAAERSPRSGTWSERDAPGDLPPLDCDLQEAARYLPDGTPQERRAFSIRQIRARRRAWTLREFYRRYPCRMGRLHLLAAFAVAIGRSCGYSAEFDRIGEWMMPVDPAGRPRTSAWERYTEASSGGLPAALREELWLDAYMSGIAALCAAGLERAFESEAALHLQEPAWQLLRQHMEVTVGARRIDPQALEGLVSHEFAMAQTLGAAVRQLFTASRSLLGHYVRESVRTMLSLPNEPPRLIAGYPQCVGSLLRLSFEAWGAARLYRRGLRQRERGRVAAEDTWPLLEKVLRERTQAVHPLIVRFYSNPGAFQVIASLRFATLPARVGSCLTTLLLGQGLYEG